VRLQISGGGLTRPRQRPVGKRGGAPTQGQAKPKITVKTRRSLHPKNQRKFWAVLIYSRVMTWGKDFKNVAKYILQNTLEALFIIAYKPRKRFSSNAIRETETTTNHSRQIRQTLAEIIFAN
jgi:hypothetical protein